MVLRLTAPAGPVPAAPRRWATLLMAAGCTAALALAGPGPAHAEPSGGLASVQSCLQRLERPVLDVLLVLDASGSIKDTDQHNQRLAAVQIALDELARLAHPAQAGQVPIDVDVQRAVFSGGFSPVGGWERIDGDSGAAAAAAFGAVELAGDTNYLEALDRARGVLAARAAQESLDRPACQMLLWLTDGRYEPIDPSLPGFTERVTAGTEALCRPGGVLEQLRGNGVTVVTVGLTTKLVEKDEAFLRQLSGTEPGCGRTDAGAAGQYLRADDPKGLARTFLQIAVFKHEESEPCVPARDGCTFDLEPGLHHFAALIEPGAAGAAITLRPPGGGGVTLGRPSGSASAAGTRLDWHWYGSGDRALVVLHGELSRTDTAWAGRWVAEFTRGGQGGGSVYLYGDVTVRLDDDLVFRRDKRPWTFTVHRQNADGDLPALPLGASAPTITVTVASPADGAGPQPAQDVTESPDGWTVRFDPPQQWRGNRVDISVQLTVRTASGIDISPSPVPGRATVVSAVAVTPDPLQFPAIEGAGTSRRSVTIRGADRDQCVWIEGGGADLTTVPEVDPVRVRVDGPGANREQCLPVPANEERSLQLTASATGSRGWTGLSHGQLTVVSADADGKVERTEVEAKAPLDAAATVKRSVALVWFTMSALSALPLLLFALINMFVLPRFDRRDHCTAHYELRAVGDRLERRDGRPWRPSDKDFTVVNHGRRRLDVGRIALIVRVPWARPFATPVVTFRARSRGEVQTQPVGDRPLDLVLAAGPQAGLNDGDAATDVDVAVVLDSRSAVTPAVAELIREQTERAVAALPRRRGDAVAPQAQKS
ncbi:hypothetical protein [Dactylosporangium sp. NPDC048998]|uniref:hypothetical protein n=1 Tax=Dactylosporangium sp. NPDC048998 TaxID=3363976 RepID=UPI003720BD46